MLCFGMLLNIHRELCESMFKNVSSYTHVWSNYKFPAPPDTQTASVYLTATFPWIGLLCFGLSTILEVSINSVSDFYNKHIPVMI